MSQIPTYSPGSIIKEIDWVEKLAEFEKKEKIKTRDTHHVVVSKHLLFQIDPDNHSIHGEEQLL